MKLVIDEKFFKIKLTLKTKYITKNKKSEKKYNIHSMH